MATADTRPADDEPTPPGYRPVELTGLGERRWVHRETGLAVDLFRYAEHRTADATGVPDAYRHELVIRPDGPDGRGVTVERTTEGDPVALAVEWMGAHPDGRFDGGEA